jgi:ubiquinone biosynthesis accessory factor UbiJ
MPATPAWLASAEAVFNRNIPGSSRAAALAKRLGGTSLQVDIDGITRVRAACFDGRLALTAGDDSPADAVIAGTAPALLQMFRRASPAVQSGSSIQIKGDAEIADRYRELFVLARPDLEEELSRLLGDLPARQLSQLARGVRSWASRARRTAGENIAEYLQEEGRDLVTKTEMEEFLRGVDGARDTLERVEARIAGIERRLKGT